VRRRFARTVLALLAAGLLALACVVHVHTSSLWPGGTKHPLLIVMLSISFAYVFVIFCVLMAFYWLLKAAFDEETDEPD
jgi:Na+/pantothenate symporter